MTPYAEARMRHKTIKRRIAILRSIGWALLTLSIVGGSLAICIVVSG